MQFLTDNYIWFLVIGIIVVMTIIGYIAEKTDFGHKEIKRAEKKAKKVAKDVKKLKKDNVKLNDVIYSKDNKSNVEVVDTDKVKEEDIFAFNDLNVPEKEEDLTVPLSGVKEEKKVEEDLTVPLNGIKDENKVEEDLTVPLSGIKDENKVEEDLTVPLSGIKEENKVEEDLTVPLNGSDEKKEQPLSEVEEDLTVPLSDSMPDDSLVNETDKEEKKGNGSDDIWKF